MEVVALEKFNKLRPSTVFMTKFHSRLSDEVDQDASTTVTNIHILLQFLLIEEMISPLLKTMWDYTDGCANHYCCASDIYLLSCLTLYI